jgi:signal peptidase
MMKFLSTFFYIIFIAMIVGVAGLLLGSMLPIPGNIEMKIVKSGSMEPAIPTGSMVVVKPQSLYHVGDVITFGADSKTQIPTTHRIIAHNDDGTFTVKGDANEDPDTNPVQRKDIIGKVAFSLPYVGYVLDFARQPIGFALLIAIPAGLVILEEVLTIFKETRKWMRKRDDDEEEGDDPQRGVESLSAHLKKVYIRRRAMDEIFVPRIVAPSRFARFLHSDSYGTSTALTVCLVFASTLFAGASGGTVSYFQDIEKSLGNVLAAGARWEEEVLAELAAQKEQQLLVAAVLSEGSVLGESIACEGDECPAGELPADEPAAEPEKTAPEPEVIPDAETPPVEEPPTDTPAETSEEPAPEPASEPPAETPASEPPTEPTI